MNPYFVTKEEKDFLIGNTSIKINKKSFKKIYFCTTAKELKTKKEILFYKFEETFVSAESIGNLIIMASGLDSDIIVAFVKQKTISITQTFNWLQKISDKKFILLLSGNFSSSKNFI